LQSDVFQNLFFEDLYSKMFLELLPWCASPFTIRKSIFDDATGMKKFSLYFAPVHGDMHQGYPVASLWG
jgi:hypothetical protein